VWSIAEGTPESALEHEPHFVTLAARQWIRAQTKTIDASGTGRIAALDRVHGLAKRFGIVTSYSSMLVLVDDMQRQRLAHAESQNDRFDREVERGDKSFSSPVGGFASLTSTPEPHEWALLAVGLMFAIFLKRRQNAGSGRVLLERGSI
jgi:putative PEP-CTERM system integral membrane protein